jgi:hypothetical protein
MYRKQLNQLLHILTFVLVFERHSAGSVALVRDLHSKSVLQQNFKSDKMGPLSTAPALSQANNALHELWMFPIDPPRPAATMAQELNALHESFKLPASPPCHPSRVQALPELHDCAILPTTPPSEPKSTQALLPLQE